MIPLSVLIPTKNESRNLRRCLEPLIGWADEIVVVDSQSRDATIEQAEAVGATVVQFHYEGGWPKKRQWALENHRWRHEWVLLLDADEILTDSVKHEIEEAISNSTFDGYWIRFQIVFMGRLLRFGDTALWKRSLFRLGRGRFERRLESQDTSMADIEIHEHVIVDGKTGRLRHPIRHENFNLLHRYIDKHNEYSTWEAHVLLYGTHGDLPPSLFGTQAQRRRWMKRLGFKLPGTSLLRFLYIYLIRFGILDGIQGLIYATFKMIQTLHVKAKLFELRHTHGLNTQSTVQPSRTNTARIER